MGLLATLNLPERPPAIKPQPIMGITAAQGVEVSKEGARPIAVKATQPAEELRGRLDAKQRNLRDAYAKLATHQPKLEAAIAAANGDTKKAMEAQKADVEKHLAGIERQLKAVDADRRAIDDPRTDAKAMNDILARNKSQTGVGQAVEIDRHDGEFEKKRTENHETKTTTSYADGKSTTRTSDKTDTVGLDGATRKRVESMEKQTASGKTSTSVTRTDKLSKEGYSGEKVTRRDHEVDGKTSSIEKKSGLNVGPDGISSSEEHKVTHADGSGTSTSATTKVERGDGKLGAARATSTGKTDADGNEQKTTTKTKGGLIAGKDGLGAYGEREKAFERKGKNGLTTGAVAGLNANVVCNVKAIEGTPPSYDLSISINLGVSASLSAKKEKEDSGGVGASASGSVAVFMNRHYVLAEAEAGAYVASLKAASAGGGGGTQQEFAIIRTGVSKSWDAAREMYLAASGKALDPKELAKMKAGESVETGTKKKVGAGVNADVKGVGVEGGYELGHDESMKVTKEKDGKLTYDASQGDSEKLSGGAKVGVGVVAGGATFSHTHTTSKGYKISIDPAQKNAAQMQTELAACKNQGDLDAFAKKYKQTVQESTTGKGTADTQGASIAIGGAKAALGYGNSVDETVTRDKDGKLKSKTVTGANKGGLELSIGKLKVGDSGEEKAAAEIDADGNATVDVGKTHTSTDAVKFLQTLPGMGDKGGDKKGALSKAAGGGEPADTDTKDVQGIKLKGDDLKYLGYLACNDTRKWMSACPSPRMIDDWKKAGNAIRRAGGSQAAVAEELAKFVGADSVGRSDVVNALVRPSGNVSSGSRYEFPDTLTKSKGDYDSLVIADSEASLDALAKGEDGAKKAADAGAALLDKLEHLYRAIASAQGFTQPAVQGEMLGAINSRKQKVQAKLRVLGGGKADALSKKEVMEKYNELLRTCTNFKNIETGCFQKIASFYKGAGTPNLNETIEAGKLIKQLRDLHATWGPTYDEMASLAQENGFGKDIYWKYKPDHARFDRAVKGNPGDASAAQAETADKRKKKEPSPEDEEAARQTRKEMDNDAVKRTRAIEQQLPGARSRAYALAKQLDELLNGQSKPAAVKAYDEADALVHQADIALQKCKPHYVADVMSYGVTALADYNNAIQALSRGIGLYPKQPAAKK